MDILRLHKPHPVADQHRLYVRTLLAKAMVTTVEAFDPYRIELTLPCMQGHRVLQELISGKHSNVHMVPCDSNGPKIPTRSDSHTEKVRSGIACS